jgi:hypothetical protein
MNGRRVAMLTGVAFMCNPAIAQVQIPSSAIRPGIDAEQSMRGGPEPRSVMREPERVSSLAAELARAGVTPTPALLQGNDPDAVAAALRAAASVRSTPPRPESVSVTDMRQGLPSATAIVEALRAR